MLRVIITFFILLSTLGLFAQTQGVSINATGNDPDPSAILDVQSTDKGVLIPRMSLSDRLAIANPATGLMVYDTDAESFWFYNGTAWTQILAGPIDQIVDSDGDTQINVEQTANENQIRMEVGGMEALRIDTVGKVGIGHTTPLEQLDVNGAIRLANTDSLNEGTIRYDGDDFEGFDGTEWKSLTQSEFRRTGILPANVIGGGTGTLLAANDVVFNSAFTAFNRYQSFTALQSGDFSKMELHLDQTCNSCGASFNIPFSVQIYEGEGTGGNLLYSGIEYADIPYFTSGWYLLFDNKFIPVIAGNKYTVAISATGPNSNKVNIYGRGGNPYSGGISDETFSEIDWGFRVYAASIGQVDMIEVDSTSGSMSLYGGKVHILQNGNVGIGTTGPQNKLHIEGSLRMNDGSQQAGYVMTSDADGVGSWQAPASDHLGNHIATQNLQIGTNWLSGDGDNEGLYIDGSGNIGIGNSIPLHKLDFGATLGRKLALYQNSAGTSLYGFGISGSTLEIYAGNNVGIDPRMVVKSSGRVGIGKMDPDEALDVVGTIKSSASIKPVGIVFPNAFGPDGTYVGTGGNYLAFGHAGTSEDFIGYKNNAFFFKDSPGGGDTDQPNVIVGGRLGVGTDNPTRALVEISGTVSSTINEYGWLDYKGAIPSVTGKVNSSSNTKSFSLWANGTIAAAEFNAHSDMRIKNIKGISNSTNDLETLMKIEITDYTLRDTISKGKTPEKKVIAQQVAEIYPQAVTNNLTEVVPDIYQRAEVDNGWIMLGTDLEAGERVKIISEKKAEVYEVLEVESNRFKVQLPSNVLDKPSTVFVYGREVNDFHTVDYEAISMLNVSATQELKRIIDLQESEIETLKKQNAQLKNDFEKRFEALETLLSNLSSQSEAKK